MIEVKLAFKSYEEALEAMAKLAGQAVIQEVKPTHEHVKPEPVKEKKEKVVKSEPVAPVVESPSANVMPAPPVFDNPVPEPVVDVATGIPFNDPKGMIAYVMESYKALGAEKGQGIQKVLAALEYSNINDVDPSKYADLYKGIESLKGLCYEKGRVRCYIKIP